MTGFTLDDNGSDDTLDVRDIIARVEELEGEKEGLDEALADARKDMRDTVRTGIGSIPDMRKARRAAKRDLREWKDLWAVELAILTEFLDELKGYGGDEQWRGDWYPVTLIHDRYFVEAMQELCEEIGDAPRDGFPSYIVIDWKATAENLRVDYGSVELNSQTYWYR